MDDKITADLRTAYGLDCTEIVLLPGGWLNKLWKVSTGTEAWLVKQYSHERFSNGRLDAIEAALQRQILLRERGIPCPEIRCHQGRTIRLLDEETSYMVMDFCPGKNQTPETVTLEQLYSLGSACARMHRAFSQLPEDRVRGFPIDSGKTLAALWDNFQRRRDTLEGPEAYQRAVLAQKPILDWLTEDFFDRLPKGIAHEDFTPDNLLFDARGVSAIIDFDRNQYSFLWHDIGRVLLSFALQDGRLHGERIRSFLEGYSLHLPLTVADVADALRVAWCIEVFWWVRPDCFAMATNKASRYRDEILWLEKHWFEIDAMLGSN